MKVDLLADYKKTHKGILFYRLFFKMIMFRVTAPERILGSQPLENDKMKSRKTPVV